MKIETPSIPPASDNSLDTGKLDLKSKTKLGAAMKKVSSNGLGIFQGKDDIGFASSCRSMPLWPAPKTEDGVKPIWNGRAQKWETEHAQKNAGHCGKAKFSSSSTTLYPERVTRIK